MFDNWHPLGSVLYRKWLVYDMKWKDNIKLENYLICGAPYGGPIALISDAKKSAITKLAQTFLIYTSSGTKLAEFEWKDKNVMGMGWTDQEYLSVLIEDGTTKIFDIFGKKMNEFNLFEHEELNIIESTFWGNGIAAFASNSKIYVAEGISTMKKEPRIYSMNTGLGYDRTFCCMNIIQPQLSKSGFLEVLVGTSDNSILVIHESENDNLIEDQYLQKSIEACISKISIAPNGKFLACFRRDGILTVMSSAFTSKVLDFDTQSLSPPIEISWCGEDSVVMHWKNTGIVMVGPFGDWINFPNTDSSNFHLVPEIDCCRIISSNQCEILQRVPDSTVSIRSVGSTAAPALLFDAMEAFEEGDPISDENIRSIEASNELFDAVLSCINAASAEFDVSKQQTLLKAASYGKAFCPDADPTDFVETAKKLRILNEVRRPEIGLPLTIQQFNRLTAEVLIGRLTLRNHHYLALKICEILKIRNERVLIHWACEKVKRLSSSQLSDEEISNKIKNQMEPFGRVSYLAIAETANNANRKKLATLLLENEQDPSDQIPLLLKMNEEELALQKAINSEDTDLVYYTLISLEDKFQRMDRSIENFYQVVHSYPEASNLLKIYYKNKTRSEDQTLLQNLLLYSKNYFEAGLNSVNLAFQQDAPNYRIQKLKDAYNFFGSSKDLSFYKTLTEDEMDLVEFQKNLKLRSTNLMNLDDQNITKTIEDLVLLSIDEPGNDRWIEQEITKLMKKFKISDKILWYIKVDCCSKRGNWNLLYKVANEKKSPIGYKPFAKACLKYERPVAETERYVEKITDLEDKFDMFVELKLWKKAADIASKLKDPYKLQEIARVCKDSALERHIQDILSKI